MASVDKIDLSLDDIIKLNKKTKAQSLKNDRRSQTQSYFVTQNVKGFRVGGNRLQGLSPLNRMQQKARKRIQAAKQTLNRSQRNRQNQYNTRRGLQQQQPQAGRQKLNQQQPQAGRRKLNQQQPQAGRRKLNQQQPQAGRRKLNRNFINGQMRSDQIQQRTRKQQTQKPGNSVKVSIRNTQPSADVEVRLHPQTIANMKPSTRQYFQPASRKNNFSRYEIKQMLYKGGGRGGSINRGRGGNINRGRGGSINRGRGGSINSGRGGIVNRGRGGRANRSRGGRANRSRGGRANYGRGGRANQSGRQVFL